MNYTVDVGPGVQSIGGLWLFLHYVLPLIVGLVVILLLGAFLFWFLRHITRNPINWSAPTLPKAPQVRTDEEVQ